MINLKNKTFWAMQMWDSSAKTEFGMLYGNVYQGGNFDECLTVRKPVQSQYCGVTIRIDLNGEFGDGDPYELDPKPTDSVWKKLKDSRIDQSKWPRDNATWGLCVPASCSPVEMHKSIIRHLDRINAKLNGTIKYVSRMDPNHCQTQEMIKVTAGEITFWCVAVFIAFLVGTSTLYDIWKEYSMKDNKNTEEVESKPIRLFMSFSVKRNFPRMMTPEDKSGVQELKLIYPAKYCTIVFIIIAHRFGIFFSTAVVNYQTYEENLRSFHNMFMPQGDLLVDTFFFVSGMLGSFGLLFIYHKKFVNPIMIVIGRLFRLAPLYYFLVWFHSDALYRMGTGPAWVGLKPEVEFCQKNWWTNILFVNNYVNIEESCMLHTWYIPCDMQLFLIGLALAIITTKCEKAGISITVFLAIVSGAIPAIYTYYYHLFPLNMYYHHNLGSNIRLGAAWKYLYVPTQSRAAVYFIGFLAGYAYFKTRNIQRRIHLGWALLIQAVGFGLFFVPMLYGSFYYNPRKQYDVVESSLFAAFRRISWGLGAFTIVMGYRFSKLPLVTAIVNSNFFVPFSKVTYAVYLVHFYMITLNFANTRIPFYYRYYDMIVSTVADVFISTFYGAVLYLSIELPFKVFFHELIFARVVKKVQKKIEEKENRRTIQDVLAKQEPEIPQIVSVKF